MIRAILFDKDGTLFDFSASWAHWAQGFLLDLAQGDISRANAYGGAIGFDREAAIFAPDSLAIAGTTMDTARALARASGLPLDTITTHLHTSASTVQMVETLPLKPYLATLRAAHFALGVATNDMQAAARAHLHDHGIEGAFDFIAGADSGHGAKPDPGMCLAFCTAVNVPPAQAVMVGDSTADLLAGRAAGMQTVAVLTGIATADALAPYADAVLPDISHLPDWLNR